MKKFQEIGKKEILVVSMKVRANGVGAISVSPYIFHPRLIWYNVTTHFVESHTSFLI